MAGLRSQCSKGLKVFLFRGYPIVCLCQGHGEKAFFFFFFNRLHIFSMEQMESGWQGGHGLAGIPGDHSHCILWKWAPLEVDKRALGWEIPLITFPSHSGPCVRARGYVPLETIEASEPRVLFISRWDRTKASEGGHSWLCCIQPPSKRPLRVWEVFRGAVPKRPPSLLCARGEGSLAGTRGGMVCTGVPRSIPPFLPVPAHP